MQDTYTYHLLQHILTFGLKSFFILVAHLVFTIQHVTSYKSQLHFYSLGHDACVDLHEVVGVKAIKIPPKTSTLNLRTTYIEMQPIGPIGFSVVTISRPGGHKWKYKQISFQCKDSHLCQQWIHAIKEALRDPGLLLKLLVQQSYFEIVKLICETRVLFYL